MGKSPSRSGSLPRKRTKPHPKADRNNYLTLSRQPLHILCFLLPLIVAYELGSAAFLTESSGQLVHTVSAERIIAGAFEYFGVLGVYLPAIAMVVVLLLWHVFTRDSWRIRPTVLLGMAAESVLWTFPLLVLASLLDPAVFAQTGIDDPASWSQSARLTISVGAGLYEELLFRMVAIACFHFVLVDLLRASDRVGSVAAVALAALAFGLYHTMPGPLEFGWLLLYVAAGAYFGVVYLSRGFGIVVATHAIYDIMALVVLPQHQG